MKKVLSLLSLLALMPASSMLLADPAGDSAALIDQAEAARKQADALGYEWRDTASLIKDAKAALEKGQVEESNALASGALLQGRQAVAQAQFMEKNWEMMIPKN
ncbi:hypothetical protein EST62_05110 [Chlorobaculum sp. 24CR]|uniref:hypothetical protein n=1 Tax=Chlorobaculum sp. 24CR TaxID=2508878 RepID=UPI00100BE12E|nr:hypothetical protein [Chlorobaculum sp. 24CR]RXK87893.1 hypothetical protein EST62_05110 [Chlorobaculum sp. 24CR]